MKNLYKDNPHFRDTRLPSLFSDFKQLEQTNNEGFKANIDAWRSVIVKYMTENDHLCCTYDDLIDSLKYTVNGKVYRPLGIYLVLNRLVNEDHSVIPLSEYMKSSLSTDHTLKIKSGLVTSFFNVLWPPKHSNTLVSFDSKGNGKEEYMLLDKLIEYSELIKGQIPNVNDPMNKKQLYDLTKGKLNISESEFEKCLIYLSRDVGELQMVGTNVVVLRASPETQIEQVVTEGMGEDLQVMASLNFIIYQLSNHSDEKHKQLDELRKEIIEDLKKDHKMAARGKQRRSKVIKAQLEDTIVKLEQLNILKLKMEQAENNRLVLSAFETNSKVLKKLNSETTNIDSIIDDLMGEIDKTEETTNVLADSLENGPLAVAEDEEAINNELDELQKEIDQESKPIGKETELEELNSKLESLNIPKHDPAQIEEENTFIEAKVPMAN